METQSNAKQVIDTCLALALEAKMSPVDAKNYANSELRKTINGYGTNNPFKPGDDYTLAVSYLGNKMKQYRKDLKNAPVVKRIKENKPQETNPSSQKKQLPFSASEIYEGWAKEGFIPANRITEIIFRKAGFANFTASASLSVMKRKYILEEVRVGKLLVGYTVTDDPKRKKAFSLKEQIRALQEELKNIEG